MLISNNIFCLFFSLCTTKVQQAQAKQVSIPFPLAELSPLLSSGNETGAPGKRA
jgi:hypothetical protein